jgi:hypothetical protein
MPVDYIEDILSYSDWVLPKLRKAIDDPNRLTEEGEAFDAGALQPFGIL